MLENLSIKVSPSSIVFGFLILSLLCLKGSLADRFCSWVTEHFVHFHPPWPRVHSYEVSCREEALFFKSDCTAISDRCNRCKSSCNGHCCPSSLTAAILWPSCFTGSIPAVFWRAWRWQKRYTMLKNAWAGSHCRAASCCDIPFPSATTAAQPAEALGLAGVLLQDTGSERLGSEGTLNLILFQPLQWMPTTSQGCIHKTHPMGGRSLAIWQRTSSREKNIWFNSAFPENHHTLLKCRREIIWSCSWDVTFLDILKNKMSQEGGSRKWKWSKCLVPR